MPPSSELPEELELDPLLRLAWRLSRRVPGEYPYDELLSELSEPLESEEDEDDSKSSLNTGLARILPCMPAARFLCRSTSRWRLIYSLCAFAAALSRACSALYIFACAASAALCSRAACRIRSASHAGGT